MKYITALLSIVLVLGCIGAQSTFSGKVVAKGDHIALDYTGSFENGTVFDSSSSKGPLEFYAGQGQMIKGFDAAVIGMHVGEEKNVTIAPQEAYGLYDARNIIEAPISSIPNNTKVGDTLYAGTQSVRVIEINSTVAVLDANHPLAGKTLIFRIRLVKIY